MGLAEGSIIQVARGFIRKHGVDALSMRILAKELGVSPMAVYYYFADKDELLFRIRDSIVAEVPMEPPDGARWEAQIRAYLTTGIRTLAGYPGLMSYTALRSPTPAELVLTRYGMEILEAAGFEPGMAVTAITSLHCALFGLVVAYRPNRGRQGRVEVAHSHRRKPDFQKVVDFTIDTLLKGLHLQWDASRQGPAQALAGEVERPTRLRTQAEPVRRRK